MASLKKSRWGKQGGLVLTLGLILAAVAALGYWGLSRLDHDDPSIQLKPDVAWVGPKTSFTVQCSDPDSGLNEVKVTFTQDGQEKLILTRAFPPGGEAGHPVELSFTLEPKALGFKEGKARLTVLARDRSWRHGFQGRTQVLSREVDIDLVPLTLSFLSVSHLLRPGGTGLIIYRVNKPPKESGVMVGGELFRGYPNPKGTKGDYVALFPVPRDAVGTAQVELVARPAAGEEVRQPVSLRLKPRRWRQDTINLSEPFVRRVAATFSVPVSGELVDTFLEVNRNLRRVNHEKVRQICRTSQPQPLWSGGFQRYLGKPMARYGDRRSYLWQGRTVDQQVHLGEDLANFVHTPVPGANHGVVVWAEPLGIYGQTVILDHGLGVFSMYSHLSSIEVKAGDRVEKGKVLGRTGDTGLAGGDHLHFSMLVQGEFVDPLEWWDPHWLKDQVEGLWGKPAIAAAAAQPEQAGQIQPKTRKRPRGRGRR